MRHASFFRMGLLLFAGLSVLVWAKTPRPEGRLPAMPLAEAQRLVDAGDPQGWLRVADTIRSGAMEASPAATVEILTRIYFAARASGGDTKPFSGGPPLPHSQAQISALTLLGGMPVEQSGSAIVSLTETFLRDLEALAPSQRRQSPLQAIQVPLAGVLLAEVDSPAVSGVAGRFADSEAVGEYAKWELAVAVLERRVAARPAEAAEMVLSSFRTTALLELRQLGRRVEACCAMLAARDDLDAGVLDQALQDGEGRTPEERYFAATCSASRLAARLGAGALPDEEDGRRVEAILEVLREVRAACGENRYAAKPLERAVLGLREAARDTELAGRITRALEVR